MAKSYNALYPAAFAAVLFIFTLLSITSFPSPLLWDSSVYIGMGKYIWSSGHSGLWEPSRPLLLPSLLGFFWALGLQPHFFGAVAMLLFSLGCCCLTYMLASKVFCRKTGLLSMALFSFLPSFFMLNNTILTEIPSTFFFLLGVYFSVRKRYMLSGLFLGLAFMTRFFQIILIMPLIAFVLYRCCKKKERWADFAKLIICFIIPVLIYLGLNSFLYSNPFYPFLLQSFMTQYTGWAFHKPISYYFLGLARENILFVFILASAFAVLYRAKPLQSMVLAVFACSFLLFSLAQHKEMRILIPLLPFMCILAADGIVFLSAALGKYKNAAIAAALIVFLALAAPQMKHDVHDANLGAFYDYSQRIGAGKLWISNPSFIARTDLLAYELIYFPLYDSRKALSLQEKAHQADIVMLNTCDILPCPPSDISCDEATEGLVSSLKSSLSLVYSENVAGCDYYIFEGALKKI